MNSHHFYSTYVSIITSVLKLVYLTIYLLNFENLMIILSLQNTLLQLIYCLCEKLKLIYCFGKSA